ncbi:MAG: MFS transporter [Alphaproteobacteria bacterium]|nr:MFS transporter [Alphaproteobacteria bacterium]
MKQGGGFGGIAHAFRNRNFRIYWTGNLTHTITVWVNRMAFGWLTWEMTHSPLWLGIVAAANMAPSAIIAPFAGVTADRYGHRTQLVTATYLGAVLALVMTFLVAFDMMTIGLLAGLSLLTGFIRAFNVPARSAMVSSLVERQYLSSAIGVNSATFHGGNFVGPLIGGLLIKYFGISLAFFSYALGEFIAATSFLLLNIVRTSPAGKKFRLFSDLADGLRYTFSHAGIRAMLILSAATNMFVNPYLEMLPAFVAQVYKLDVTGLTYLTSATGCGAMIGGLWIAQRGRLDGLVRLQLILLLAAYCAIAAFAYTDKLAFAMFWLFIAGFALVAAQTCNSTLVQSAAAAQLRARVISLNGVIFVSGPAIGALLIGFAAEKTGVQAPMIASALLALACLGLLARRSLQNVAALEATGHETPQVKS